MCLFLRRLLRCGLLVRRRCSSRLHFSRLSRSRLLHLRRPFLQLGCLELLPIKSDLDNPHRGKVLPMPAQLLILLLAFVMEDQDLFLAALLHDFTGHLRARLGHANLARLGRDRQHVAEFNLAVGAGALAFDPNYIARRHPVLLATGADDRVHTYASVKNVPSHQVQGMESAGFPCLLLSASALLANVADGPRTEPQVQANSTILACSVRKGQTKATNLHRFPRSEPIRDISGTIFVTPWLSLWSRKSVILQQPHFVNGFTISPKTSAAPLRSR